MALTKTIEVNGNGFITLDGVSYPVVDASATYADCYIKVAIVSASKTEGQACVTFTEDAGSSVLFQKSYLFPLDLNGPNPIKQAYEHLKTLPEFVGAEDC